MKAFLTFIALTALAVMFTVGTADATTRCGTITVRDPYLVGGRWQVYKVEREWGHFSCRDAGNLFRDCYKGRGVRRHCWFGGTRCPNATAYYTMRRWPCWRLNTGAGAVGAWTGKSARRSKDGIFSYCLTRT